MALTAWSDNPTRDALEVTYDSAAYSFDSALLTFDGIPVASINTNLMPALTAWTPVEP